MLILLLETGCSSQNANPCESQNGNDNVSFISLSDNQELKNCALGVYDSDEQWVIQSINEFELWNSNRNCKFESVIDQVDFAKNTLLIGYLSHPDTGIRVKNEQVFKSCSNNEITYTIRFETLSGSFAALSTINYGVIIPKANSNNINFNIIVDED